MKVYVIPDFAGMTVSRLLTVITDAMGQLFYSISVGDAVGVAFFVMVVFAALISSISIMEAIAVSAMDKLGMARKNAVLLVGAVTLVLGIVVCLGYNIFFKLMLPNGTVAQILDVMDYISNSVLMPVVAIATCILVGWAAKPVVVIDEVTLSGHRFGREKLYVVMVKYITPVMLLLLLAQSLGLLKFN